MVNWLLMLLMLNQASGATADLPPVPEQPVSSPVPLRAPLSKWNRIKSDGPQANRATYGPVSLQVSLFERKLRAWHLLRQGRGWIALAVRLPEPGKGRGPQSFSSARIAEARWLEVLLVRRCD